MRVESSTTVVRWVLLCALALGVLGMHHLTGPAGGHGSAGGHAAVAAEDGRPAAGQADHASGPGCCDSTAGLGAPTPSPGGDHDLLAHLCLAVLAAAGAAGLLLILLGRRPGTDPPRLPGRWSGVGGFSRSPPRPTSTRLAMLCVLRQ